MFFPEDLVPDGGWASDGPVSRSNRPGFVRFRKGFDPGSNPRSIGSKPVDRGHEHQFHDVLAHDGDGDGEDRDSTHLRHRTWERWVPEDGRETANERQEDVDAGLRAEKRVETRYGEAADEEEGTGERKDLRRGDETSERFVTCFRRVVAERRERDGNEETHTLENAKRTNG